MVSGPLEQSLTKVLAAVVLAACAGSSGGKVAAICRDGDCRTGSGQSTMPPDVVRGQRLADPRDPRYRLRVPPPHAVPGLRYLGIFKLCIDRAGAVQQVTVLRTTGVPAVDEEWMKTVRTWPHQPYVIKGTPSPYCYPLRLDVKVD